MTSKRTRADHDELGAAAKKWAAEAEHARQMVASLKQCMDTLQGGDWVGQGASAFYAEMNGQVLPALQRMAKALESAARTTHAISREAKEAEQAASDMLNGRDAAGGMNAGLAGALGAAAAIAFGGAFGAAAGGGMPSGNASGLGGNNSTGNNPFTVADYGVGDRIQTGGIDGGSSNKSSGDDSGSGGQSGGSGAGAGDRGTSPLTVSDYGVGDPIHAGAAGAAAAGMADMGGGASGAEAGGGSSGGGGSPSGGGSGSGGSGESGEPLDELDQAIQTGDPNKIAAALKNQLLRGNKSAMDKFRRLSASMEMQVANAMLTRLSSSELSQLSSSPATQQAMSELSTLRR
jgi:WXG100 family type VII secretion target